MNKTFRLFWLPIAAALLLMPLVALAQSPEPVNLRPQWQAGQTARYDYWSKTVKDERAELFGQKQEKQTTYLSEGRVAWVVDVVNDDGSFACTFTFEKLKFTITQGENPAMVIDSENPGGETPAVFDSLMSAMTSTPLSVKVNADGTIDSVQGLDELAAQAGQEAQDADIVPEEIDFLETASELATLIAAPAEATPGQTWSSKNTWNHDSVVPGAKTKGTWDTTFTFADVGNIAGVPVATIKTQSSVGFELDLGKLPENAPDIDVQYGDATARGEILFDLSRHETVARNDSLSYEANVTIAPPNDQVPPFKIKITETSQSQLLRVEEE